MKFLLILLIGILFTETNFASNRHTNDNNHLSLHYEIIRVLNVYKYITKGQFNQVKNGYTNHCSEMENAYLKDFIKTYNVSYPKNIFIATEDKDSIDSFNENIKNFQYVTRGIAICISFEDISRFILERKSY